MSTDVPFPPMSSADGTEGVLATWFVADGDDVRSDQLIAEVQVDKVTAEVMAPRTGVISLLVEEGAAVPQGSAIAVIR